MLERTPTTVTGCVPLLVRVRYAAATSVPGVARIQACVARRAGVAALAARAKSASAAMRWAGRVRKQASVAQVPRGAAIMPDAAQADRL